MELHQKIIKLYGFKGKINLFGGVLLFWEKIKDQQDLKQKRDKWK